MSQIGGEYGVGRAAFSPSPALSPGCLFTQIVTRTVAPIGNRTYFFLDELDPNAMSDDLSAALLDRIRGGDEDAAEELFHRYVVRLVQLAQNNMSRKITRRVDPEDAVQSAYRSFFRRAREGAFELRQSGDLWKLLAAITINKVRRQARKQSAQKRRIETEGSLDPLLGLTPEAVATDPTPSEAAILIEELEIVSRKLSPLHRRILELRGQGHSIPETANVAGCTERTVYRAEERYESLLRERLQTLTK